VTCGCPIMDKLRPMAYTHLPFANSGETVYRVLGTYLLAQYFLYKDGLTPDWDLENLQNIYEDIRVVNKSFSERVTSVINKDAGVNALVLLDCFAIAATMTISGASVKSLKKIFKAYFGRF
ncbi:MAG: hypothetical protein QME32_07975, partial [Endomicrobiia bacterium]|nr:hypothetical protein [Endomicrobiia bacterium]